MKKSLLQFSIYFLMGVILLAGCATVQKAGDVESFRAALEDIMDTYSAAMNSENTDLWITVWDENGIQMFPGAPARKGKSVIEEAVREAHQALDFEKFTINNEEVEVFGDFGFARGNYSYVMTPKAGGETILFEGKYLTIFKRQPDGSWTYPGGSIYKPAPDRNLTGKKRRR